MFRVHFRAMFPKIQTNQNQVSQRKTPPKESPLSVKGLAQWAHVTEFQLSQVLIQVAGGVGHSTDTSLLSCKITEAYPIIRKNSG